MKIKTSIIKDLIYEIKLSKNFIVYLSLLIILSTSFFISMNQISYSMEKSIKKYYNEINFMDIKITSTTGFTDSNIISFKNIKDINGIMLSKSLSANANIKNNNYVFKINSINKSKNHKNNNYINQLTLTSGKYPSTINECLVEEKFIKDNNLSLGSLITLEPENNNWLKAKKIKITGTVKNEYAIHDRKIDYYVYLDDNNFNIDFYKEVYLTLNTQNKNILKYEYSKYINEKKEEIQKIVTEITNERHNYLIPNLNDEIYRLENTLNNIYNLDVPQEHVNDFLKNTSEELNNAMQQLSNIKNTKVEIITRDDISKFHNYNKEIQNINIMTKIISIFPILIITLVCLYALIKKTNINKKELLLLKTLGYNNFYICIKYVTFALLFSFIGCIIGSLVISKFTSFIIHIIHKNIYDINLLFTDINKINFIKMTLSTTIFIIFCTIMYLLFILKNKNIKTLTINKNKKINIFNKIKFTINKDTLLITVITYLCVYFNIISLLIKNSLSNTIYTFSNEISSMISIFSLILTFVVIIIIFFINSETLINLKIQNIYNIKNHFSITYKYCIETFIGIILAFLLSSFNIIKIYNIDYNTCSYLVTILIVIMSLIFANIFTYHRINTTK